ncbi:MAG: hypothetical protein AB4062_02660 [Crocosphaera sp.]
MARQVCGTVNDYGEIVAGSGFSVKRLDKGFYEVVFDNPFYSIPVVVSNVVGHPWRTFNMSTAIADQMGPDVFYCLTSTPDQTEDCGFSFIATGD